MKTDYGDWDNEFTKETLEKIIRNLRIEGELSYSLIYGNFHF